jgi:hypothetical protein
MFGSWVAWVADSGFVGAEVTTTIDKRATLASMTILRNQSRIRTTATQRSSNYLLVNDNNKNSYCFYSA